MQKNSFVQNVQTRQIQRATTQPMSSTIVVPPILRNWQRARMNWDLISGRFKPKTLFKLVLAAKTQSNGEIPRTGKL